LLNFYFSDAAQPPQSSLPTPLVNQLVTAVMAVCGQMISGDKPTMIGQPTFARNEENGTSCGEVMSGGKPTTAGEENGTGCGELMSGGTMTGNKMNMTKVCRKKSKKQKKFRPTSTLSCDTTPCMFCGVKYCDSDCSWSQCVECRNWACYKCAPVDCHKSFCCVMCSTKKH
jgi:hypothetical protein